MRAPKFFRLQIVAMMAIALLALPGVALAYAPTGDDFLTCSPEDPSPGAVVNCTVGVCDEGSSVAITVDQDPNDDESADGDEIYSDTVTADSDGTATFSFTLPGDFDVDEPLDVTSSCTFEGETKVLGVQFTAELQDDESLVCDPKITVPDSTVECIVTGHDGNTDFDALVEASVLLDTTFTSNADGTYTFTFDVPADHETNVPYFVTTTGQQNGDELVQRFEGEILPDEDGDGLPDTGIEAGGLLLTALGAIVIGGGVLALGRRRTRTTV